MQYLPINWQDGMKVNQGHFVGMENAARAELLELAGTQVNALNYGLLPEENGYPSLDLYFKNDQSNTIVLNLVTCNAVTPDGMKVMIASNQQHQKEVRQAINELPSIAPGGALYVFINIRPFNRQATGKKTNEDPPRIPFTKPYVFLTVDESKDAIGQKSIEASQLLIGRLHYKNGNLELDKQFIPPCSTIVSHSTLKNIHQEWTRALDALYNNGLNTLRRVEQITAAGSESVTFGAGQKVSVADSVRHLTRVMLNNLSDLMPAFQQLMPELSPIYSIVALQQLAKKLRVNLAFFSKTERNELLNYLKEALSISSLLEELDNFTTIRYDHEDIATSVIGATQFLNLLIQLYHPNTGLPTKNFNWKKEEGTIIIKGLDNDKPTTIAD